MRSQKWRLGITLVVIILACLAYWDTFRLWTMSEEERQTLQERDPGELLELQQEAIRLGLDLQGGIHVVLRVKSEELEPAAREGAVDRAIQIIRNRIDGLGVAEPVIQKQGRDRIIVDLPGYTDERRAEDLIGQTALLEFKLLENFENASLLLEKVDSAVHEYEMALAGEGADSATSEIDTLAVADTAEQPLTEEAEDTVSEEEEVDMLAELMGDSVEDTFDFGFDETPAVEEDIRPVTSRLELSLYNNRTATNWPGFVVNKKDRPRIEKWLNLPEVKRLMPIGC